MTATVTKHAAADPLEQIGRCAQCNGPPATAQHRRVSRSRDGNTQLFCALEGYRTGMQASSRMPIPR